MKIIKILFVCILSYSFSSLHANDIFQIKSKWTNRCLDVVSEDKGLNGNRVTLRDCHDGINQKWEFIKFSTGYNLIQTKWTQRVLDVALEGKGLNGNKIHLWNSFPDSINQQWKFTKLDNGSYIIQSRWKKNKCLNVNAGDKGLNNSKIILWDCNYEINQQWILQNIK